MNYQDAEFIAIGKLAIQLHYELKGERLQLFDLPCQEAMQRAIETIRGADAAIAELTPNAHR